MSDTIKKYNYFCDLCKAKDSIDINVKLAMLKNLMRHAPEEEKGCYKKIIANLINAEKGSQPPKEPVDFKKLMREVDEETQFEGGGIEEIMDEDKIFVIPKDTILYHGTMHTLNDGYPTAKANWFTIDPEQAGLHVFRRMGISSDIYGYQIGDLDDLFEGYSLDDIRNVYPKIYIYRVKKPIYLFNIGNTDDMKHFATLVQFDFDEKGDFSESNKKLAEYLCQVVEVEIEGINEFVVGWYRMKDQKEIVICKPQDFLEKVDILTLTEEYIHDFEKNDISWKHVQKYMYDFKKYLELKKEFDQKTTIEEIKTLLDSNLSQFEKFNTQPESILEEDSEILSNEEDYNSLDKFLQIIRNKLSRRFRFGAGLRYNNKMKNYYQVIENHIDLYNAIENFAVSFELYSELLEPYQIAIDKLAENNKTLASYFEEFENLNEKLEQEAEYSTDLMGDELVSKAVAYIVQKINPIVNKIHFCRLVKEKDDIYVCKSPDQIQNNADINCSFWTSEDKSFLKDVATGFGYTYTDRKPEERTECFM